MAMVGAGLEQVSPRRADRCGHCLPELLRAELRLCRRAALPLIRQFDDFGRYIGKAKVCRY